MDEGIKYRKGKHTVRKTTYWRRRRRRRRMQKIIYCGVRPCNPVVQVSEGRTAHLQV
jgi:hypothetical protein